MKLRADEAVNQEESDRVERAITTDASLEAAQDSDNITKTQTIKMPNVDIPRGIDTGGRPRRQETMGGTSAKTRSERVLEQPNEPPLTEGHTSGSREDILEENIELTDTVPASYDSPLTGGYTSVSDEGRITLAKLMETCTILSNRVTQLEAELSTTKAVYNKAFITLTNRVNKLKSQLKQKRSKAVIYSSEKEGPSVQIEDSPKQGRIVEEMDKDKNINLLYVEELAKEEARQEQERYNLEKALELQRQLDQRKESVPKEIDWNDLQVLRERSHERARFDLQQGSSKKQRIGQQTKETKEEAEAHGDSDPEVEELKLYTRIIPKEDIAIEDIPLAIKPSVIIEYKNVKEGKISIYHITRAYRSTRIYTSMINLLRNIDREDLETIWKLVKDKYGNTRPEEGYERVLWGDLKVMFEPDIESDVEATTRT
uniref:Reverse transcriptase domain-containing protein n=1 Tax=Tanacetum cinerariifolium TaxID=118510 RepID=A0A699HMV6_TANCI|nr:hypothetical protein [Tanacetum cinerariifolium]